MAQTIACGVAVCGSLSANAGYALSFLSHFRRNGAKGISENKSPKLSHEMVLVHALGSKVCHRHFGCRMLLGGPWFRLHATLSHVATAGACMAHCDASSPLQHCT